MAKSVEKNYSKRAIFPPGEQQQFLFYKILENEGIKHRIARNVDLRLESIESIRRYFRIVGSHNPKHLMRYSE